MSKSRDKRIKYTVNAADNAQSVPGEECEQRQSVTGNIHANEYHQKQCKTVHVTTNSKSGTQNTVTPYKWAFDTDNLSHDIPILHERSVYTLGPRGLQLHTEHATRARAVLHYRGLHEEYLFRLTRGSL